MSGGHLWYCSKKNPLCIDHSYKRDTSTADKVDYDKLYYELMILNKTVRTRPSKAQNVCKGALNPCGLTGNVPQSL